MKNKVREVAVLFTVAIVSAFLLSFVYKETRPVILEYASKQLSGNLFRVFSDSTVRFETVKNDTLWRVYKGDSLVGIIFRNGKQGYSSIIKPIVGVNSTGKIIKIMIPQEGLSETPGLGMKVTEEWFEKQFSGLTLDDLWLKVDDENGKVDGITAATISSRATTKAVREGLIKFKDYLPFDILTGGKWYSDDVIRLGGVEELEEIIEDKLWKGDDIFIYLSYEEGFISPVGVVVSVRNDTVLEIHIQSPEEGMEETAHLVGTRIPADEFENRFRGVHIGKIDEVDALSGATMTSRAVKEAIKSGYEEFIKEKK